jgi:superfamily II DNA or RNA helicase
MSVGERKMADTALRASDDQERLILATGRYLGEGFDDARLDTLFLTMPIAWKGTLAQYVGRLHRQHDGKKDVLVVDYVDNAVPGVGSDGRETTSGLSRAWLHDRVAAPRARRDAAGVGQRDQTST